MKGEAFFEDAGRRQRSAARATREWVNERNDCRSLLKPRRLW